VTVRVVKSADGSGAITVAWDHSSIIVPDGVVVDIPVGSSMETAYGVANLVTLSAAQLINDQQGGDPSVLGNT